MWKKYLWVLAFNLLTGLELSAQTQIFAELKGNPVNTTGWNLTGNARIGDTPGDSDPDFNELIVCPNQTFTSGAIFYGTPLNLAACNKFSVDFEFRIFDGNAADGLAFCFLTNPPTGFVNGQGIGIPSNPRGLMVVFDTFDNCGQNNNPEVQIRVGNGNGNYQECPTPPQPTIFNQAYLRSNNYQTARIEYEGGVIRVFVGGVLRLTGNSVLNYNGFFGFTAATGAQTDVHAIRNVAIKMDRPIAIAGADKVVCPGDTVRLGGPESVATTYAWFPSNFLSVPNVANPLFTAVNTSKSPIPYTFVIKVDTAGIPCPSYDTVTITVNPIPENPGLEDSAKICPGLGEKLDLALGIYPQYRWSDGSTGPQITVTQPGAYWVKVSDDIGCSNFDTIQVMEFCPFTIEFPNVMTPNGDGKNDFFKGKLLGVKALKMKIFDRWGRKQYEAESSNFNSDTFNWWDGSTSGWTDSVQFGQYTWIAEVENGKGEVSIHRGILALIRP